VEVEVVGKRENPHIAPGFFGDVRQVYSVIIFVGFCHEQRGACRFYGAFKEMKVQVFLLRRPNAKACGWKR